MFKLQKNALCVSILMVVCFFASFFAMTIPSIAQENEKVIRVGFPIQPGITEIDDNGELTGYTYEYLQEIAQYTGWRYEFVRLPGSLNETIVEFETMLEEGEIDLIGTAIYSEQTAERFAFSSHSYGSVDTVLQVLTSGNTFEVDSQAAQTIKVAAIRPGKIRTAELQAYCSVNMLEPEIIYCDSSQEQVNLLTSGQVDAILSTSFYYTEGVRTVASFATKPFYFISSKENKIISELNEAMLSINSVDPYYTTQLYEKYFLQHPSPIKLSASELDFLNKNPVVTVGALSNQPPIQYLDHESNTFSGIAAATLDHISKFTGLAFEYVFFDNMKSLLQALQNDGIDMIASASFNYNDAEELNVAVTTPYLNTQYALLTSDEVHCEDMSVTGKKLALPSSSSFEHRFHGAFAEYDTTEACINAVASGAADYTYVNVFVLQHYISKSSYENLHVSFDLNNTHGIRFAVKRASTNHLLEILNRGVLNISVNQQQEIINDNTTYKGDTDNASLFVRYHLQVLIIGIVLLAIFILIILYHLKKRRNFIENTVLERKKHFAFFSLTADTLFEYDLLAHSLSISPKKGSSNADVRTFVNVPSQTSSTSVNEFVEFITTTNDGTHDVNLLDNNGKYRLTKTTVKTLRGQKNNITHVIGSVNYLPVIEQVEQDITLQNQRDSLTHVYTIDSFRNKFEASMSSLNDDNKGVFILIDLDHFKATNNKYGYVQGDEILRMIGDTLRATVMDEEAIVGRISGDTFAVYKESVSGLDRIPALCAAVQQSLRRIRLDDKNTITASIGAAVVNKGSSYNEAFQRADKMLYEAESKGRDCFEISYE